LTPFWFGFYKLVKYGLYPLTWAPYDFVFRNRPEDSWSQIEPFDFLPSDAAIQDTRGWVAEKAGIALYWIGGKF
jgi:hypothetical protein